LQRAPTSLISPPSQLLSGIAAAAVTGMDPRWVGHLPVGVSFPALNSSVEAAAAGSAQNGAAVGRNQQVPFRNPAPAFSRNLIVSRALGNYPTSTEPHIAVDPTDPDHLVLGVIDFNLPSIAIYVSFDAGETWEGPILPRYFREDVQFGGDPVIAFDRDGNVYVSQLSIGIQEFQIGTLLSATIVSTLVVGKSTDGGLTWGDAIPATRSKVTTVSQVDSEGKERGIITAGFLDKEWMTIGPSPDDPNKDVIYLTYTDFESSNTVIYADELPYLVPLATETTIRSVRSDDGGMTWSQPVPVSPTARYAESFNAGVGTGEGTEFGLLAPPADQPGTLQDEDEDGTAQVEQATTSALRPIRFVQGSQLRVLSDGTVVVAWFDSTDDGPGQGLQTIEVAISTDGGRTFGDPIQAALAREWHSPSRTIQLRIDGSKFPQIDVGPNDEIYIGYAGQPVDKPKDDGDIYLVGSFDGGKTWDEPVRVNVDEKGTLQFLPAVAVQPDGTVGVMWGDSRDDPEEIRFHVYFTQSKDKGKTFGFTVPDQNFTAPDTRVTDFPSNTNRVCPTCAPEVGDYWAMDANENDFYLVWGDTRLGEFGGFNTQIAFARQQAIPNPSLFLNPPSGTAGRIVDIQGHGFQPESNILLLVSGVVVANPRTNDKGEFTTSIYMPLTGEGPTSISAFDETGNSATASFYTEFGFDSLQRSIDAINKEVGITTPVPGTTQNQTAATPAASPIASPVASPIASPVASPVPSLAGTPIASAGSTAASSGEASLGVSSVNKPSFGALGYALMALSVTATGALFWWQRRREALRQRRTGAH
ncbi:MAG TPA: sialidase family protein, partial [Thermomicrobiales bacterium]|nr:sialidase family protein [Thermomicrobiales bacterium]